MSEGLIITLVICTWIWLLFLSFKFYRQGRLELCAGMIVLSGFVLRVYFSSDLYLHLWDERFHALVAKNLINHPFKPTLYENPVLNFDYRNWTANHIWLHKQPLALWMMALSMKFFGVNEIALRLPSLIFSSISIYLTYRIGSLCFNKKIGLFAAFLHSFNAYLIFLAAGRIPADHVDTLFIFLIELGIYLSALYAKEKKTFLIVLIGLILGLAVLTKWLTAFLILPVWLCLAWPQGKPLALASQLIRIVTISLLVFLPWQLYVHHTFPQEAAWEIDYNQRHIFEALEGHEGGMGYHLAEIGIYFGPLAYFLIAAFILLILFRKDLREGGWPILIWLALTYAFFAFAATKMPSYVMITAPAVFMIEALVWWQLWEIKSSPPWPKIAGLVILVFLLSPAKYLAIDCLWKTNSPLVKQFGGQKWFKHMRVVKLPLARNPDVIQSMRELKDRYGEEKTVFFNLGDFYIDAMFYSNASAYPQKPTESELREVKTKGYTPVLLQMIQ